MRTAPHEFYGGAMVATPSVDLDVDDGGSSPTYFTARLSRAAGSAASAVAGLPETMVTTGGDGEETCCAAVSYTHLTLPTT